MTGKLLKLVFEEFSQRVAKRENFQERQELAKNLLKASIAVALVRFAVEEDPEQLSLLSGQMRAMADWE